MLREVYLIAINGTMKVFDNLFGIVDRDKMASFLKKEEVRLDDGDTVRFVETRKVAW